MKRLIFFIFLISFVTVSWAQDEKLADQYMQQGDFKQASVIYEKLYHTNNFGENYFKKLVDAYKNDGNLSAVEDLYNKQSKRFPQEVWYRISYGEILEKKGETKSAKKAYEEALKNLPFLPDQVKRAASSFQMAGKLDYAMKAYEKAESNFGKHFYAMEKAELYFSNKQYDYASQVLIDAVKSDMRFLPSIKSFLTTHLEEENDGPFQNTWKTALLKEAQANPNEYLYNELLYWQFLQQRNFNAAFVQAKALHKRKNNGGQEVMELAIVARDNSDFDKAIECFEYLLKSEPNSSVYRDAKNQLVSTMRMKFDKGYMGTKEEIQKLSDLYKSTISEVGVYDGSAAIIVSYADLLTFYMDQSDEALEWIDKVLNSNSITKIKKADAKLKKADILIFMGDMWEPALLYGQVEKEFKNDFQGQEAKFRTARLAYFREEFEFAHDQMKVLKASTSKLFSNDAMWLSHLITDNLGRDSIRAPLQFFSKADLAFYQNQNDKALQILDTLLYFYPQHNIGDEVLYRKAQILSKQGKYSQAVVELEKVWVQFVGEVLMDDALFMAADLYQFKLDNSQKAMELYEKIILEHKDSLFVSEARKRYRFLRGDQLN